MVRETGETDHFKLREVREEVMPPCHTHLRGYKVYLRGERTEDISSEVINGL